MRHLIPTTAAAFVALLLSGCTLPPRHPASVTKDRAFISYTPVAADAGKIRVAVKDLIDMKGEVTTAGSEYLAVHGTPAARDAACLAQVRSENVVIVGKTNLPEFAVSVSGINDYFGTPKNRQSKSRRLIPGGSSSGSAGALADGLADVALGTDTAGSIRVPAACIGIAGLKTTFGLISLKGVYPVAPEHLDTVGPMARDVDGLVTGMELLKPGFTSRYSAAAAAHPSGKSIRIGRLYLKGTETSVDRAVDRALLAAGFEVVRLNEALAGEWRQAEKNAHTIAASGAWLQNEAYLAEDKVSARAKAALLLGAAEYPAGYKEAVRQKAGWQRTMRRVFREVDFIALPTLQKLPPSIPIFGRTALFEAVVLAIQNTSPVNLAGNPALAIPIPLEPKRGERRRDPLETSLQLVGPKFSEAALLNAGRLVEKAL